MGFPNIPKNPYFQPTMAVFCFFFHSWLKVWIFFGIFGKTHRFFGKFKTHLWNFWIFWKLSGVWTVSILRTALAATHRHGELYTINYGNNLQKKANVYVNISSNSWVASRFATGSTCCFSCRALLAGVLFCCNCFQLCRQGAT